MVLPTETRGANLLIDLDAIAANYRLLQRELGAVAAGQSRCLWAGYGRSAPVLSDAGCHLFYSNAGRGPCPPGPPS